MRFNYILCIMYIHYTHRRMRSVATLKYRNLVENETCNVRTVRNERLRCAFHEHFPCRGVWGQLKSRAAHDTRSAYHGDAFCAPRGIEDASVVITVDDPSWFYHLVFVNLQVCAKNE